MVSVVSVVSAVSAVSVVSVVFSPNFLSEGVRCGLDKEIALDGTYLKYFPFRAMIERSQMTPYHKKLQNADTLKDKIHILQVVLQSEAAIKLLA